MIYKEVTAGIIDAEHYRKSKFKILWILKEANQTVPEGDVIGGWDMREFLKNFNSKEGLISYPNWKNTFNLIIYTSWGILNNFADWNSIPNSEKILNVLTEIAFINLKKTPGESTSNWYEIEAAYQSNKENILVQIENINPSVIIFAGTYFEEIGMDLKLNIYEMKQKYFTIKNDQIFIDTYHPNQRVESHEKYYSFIVKTIQQELANPHL